MPLESRDLAPSTYAALLRSSDRDPDKTAITYFIDGGSFDPERIPLRARLRHLAARVIRGKQCAEPYRELSYRDLTRKVTQAANLLHANGVREGDVVSLLLPNLIETVYLTFGAEAAGVVNPVNPLLEPEIIKSILNAAGTKVLIALGPLPGSDIWDKVEAVRDYVPTLETVIVVFGRSDPDRRIISLEDCIENFSGERLDSGRVIRPTEIASLFHTGGTAGIPKLVVRTHSNQVASAKMLELAVPVTAQDTGLIGLPMFHVLASTGAIFGGLSIGMHLVLAGPKGFRTPGVLQNLCRILDHHRVSCMCAVPTLYAALLQTGVNREALRHVKFAISAGAPLPDEVFRQFKDKAGITLIEGYGQTEATLMSSINPVTAIPRVGSVGLRAPYSEMKPVVLDEHGDYVRDSDTDEIGTIVKRGPHVSLGYKLSAQNDGLWIIDEEGRRWLNSGDLGRQDEDGYFWLTGRSKELIIRGGHNIDPKIIEEALHRHPAVIEAAAVGRPDAYAGELPVAYVCVKRGQRVSSDELIAFCGAMISERGGSAKSRAHFG